MSDADDYLQEGWDPKAVTMPRLRSILVMHNIDYPSTAKKAQLVELVNQHIVPLAPKLRAQKARAKRSSMGIVNAGSAEDDGRWDDSGFAPPSTMKRSKSPRKVSNKSFKSESDHVDDAPIKSPTKRAARSTSRQLPVDNGTLPDATPARRSRRTVTPQIKHESDEELDNRNDGNAFSSDNPFQSGSSPASAYNQPATSRRKSAGLEVANSAKSSRRRTGGPEFLAKEPSWQSEPVADYDNDSIDEDFAPGEEFTPEEQLELEDAARNGEVARVPRRTTQQAKRRTAFITPISILLSVLFAVYLARYRQEKIAVGYCGLGRPAKTLLPDNIQVPDAILPLLEPQCEQCPSHAFCYEDFSTRCEPDFILKPHPLSLFGLVPIPPTCEPDGEKARRIHSVADKAVEELRERRAKFECGQLVDDEGHQEKSPAIAEEDLKATVSSKRSKRLNSAEFEDLWAAAIGEVTAREEIQVEVQATDTPAISNRKLSSSSLARISFVCSIKRSLRLRLERYRLAIGLLISVVLGTLYLRARYRRHVATSAQIPALVEVVLQRLADQKELGDEEADEPWLFILNLRDDVLRSTHSLTERRKIWARVTSVVQLNSNVRTSQRESKSGDIGRAWEWIGPATGEKSRRRRSERVSWGLEARSETPEGNRSTEVKKWEEARPIY